nr:unnamed protein product [Digitaria exilis]
MAARPSGLVVGTPQPLGTSSLRIIVQPLGRRGSASLHSSLKTTTTTGRTGHWHAIIEEQLKTFRLIFKGHLELDKDMPFREDIQRIEEFQKAMSSLNTSIFHIEATTFSLYFCMIATRGVKFASRVMESAALRFDKQDEVSSCTTKQILRPTMTDAMIFTMSYISAMVAYHEKLLGYVPGTKGRRRST